MEALMLIVMMIAKGNGMNVPVWCWIVWGAWSAAHLALAWFWNEGGMTDE